MKHGRAAALCVRVCTSPRRFELARSIKRAYTRRDSLSDDARDTQPTRAQKQSIHPTSPSNQEKKELSLLSLCSWFPTSTQQERSFRPEVGKPGMGVARVTTEEVRERAPRTGRCIVARQGTTGVATRWDADVEAGDAVEARGTARAAAGVIVITVEAIIFKTIFFAVVCCRCAACALFVTRVSSTNTP